MTQAHEKAKAIEAYKNIVAGKVEGVKIYTRKVIKYGSITFIINP